jgi:3-oxoacyl-[acyl-carrier protein] reductase
MVHDDFFNYPTLNQCARVSSLRTVCMKSVTAALHVSAFVYHLNLHVTPVHRKRSHGDSPRTNLPCPPLRTRPMSWSADLLAGKVAVVAGGGRGIGAATSHMLARAGAAVCVIDLEIERADRVAAEINSGGGRAVGAQAELRDPEQVAATVDWAVANLGGIDILVNVAGGMNAYAPWMRMADWDDETWDEIIGRNLRYVFLVTRAALRHMVAAGRGGSIVNITSISGETSAPNHSAYGAAKAGLANLTRTLSVEYGPDQIRFNAVAPGGVATPATADRTGDLGTTPLRRRADPDDIANAVVFFASPLAAFVTGQTLLVDGGATAKFPLTTPPASEPARESN